MLHIVSYSYPPDNAPAAHRPYELGRFLAATGQPYRLYTHHGRDPAAGPGAGPVAAGAAVAGSSRGGGRFAALVVRAFRPLLVIDKALPWGMRQLPRLWLDLLDAWWRDRARPDVWATAPGVTNLYIAGLAAMFSGSRLHLDLRDAIAGINREPMPLLTWLVLRYSSTCSVVTESLARLARERVPFLRPQLIYNGISEEAIASAVERRGARDGWIKLAYAGAIYGGARPYESALALLQAAAEMLGPDWSGVRLTFVGREDVSAIAERFQSARFRIVALRQLPKHDALRLSATSDANLVLIGSPEEHRCGIPLKVFDLLGAGRPIIYHGPVEADGCRLLLAVAPQATFVLDSEGAGPADAHALAGWLVQQPQSSTRPVSEPSAASQCRKIVGLIHSGNFSAEERAAK